ncbi:MAG: carbamoyltransferase [Bacteroidia bacterium]|jgi:carbamoyltransferase
MSYFVGISSLDCDSTVSIIKDGKIVYSAQEERFSRIKQQSGFPYKAIQNGFDYLKITVADVASISHGWFTPDEEIKMYKKSGHSVLKSTGWTKRPFLPTLLNQLNFRRRAQYKNPQTFIRSERDLQKGLTDIGYEKPVARFHHQDCHAASAYYTSGHDRTLIFTLDGYGSGSCGGVFIGENMEVKPLHYVKSPQSLGNMYARVTKALGFTPNRHEGKVLGLAAYGNADAHYEEIMQDFELTPDGYTYHNSLNPWIYRKMFETGKREDLAASFQKVLETVVVHLVKLYVQKTGVSKVCLAGGVAANVKMNQRVLEIDDVSELYIHPGMSDVGLGTGSAFLDAATHYTITPYTLTDVYLGPSFSQKEVQHAIDQFDFDYEQQSNIEERIAELLAEGKVVGRFIGRMEYGPRALCNRSIYASAQDPDINSWLNERLNRTEFMPFAPVTLQSEANNMYHNIDKAQYTSQFMTTTLDCTDDMKKISPAAVHVDGTARPQLINATNNPSAHKVLTHYFKLTGIPNIINTSYNMHEEPIICTPYDALKAFGEGRLEYLALDDFLLKSKDI